MNKRFLATAVLLLVALPMAAADEGELTAKAVVYSGGATQEAGLHAFYLTDGAAPDSEFSSLPHVGLRIVAETIEALSIERQSYTGEFDAGPLGTFKPTSIADPTYDAEAAPARTVLEHGRLDLTTQQAGLQMHVVPRGLTDVVAFKGRSEVGEYGVLPALAVTAGRFGEPEPLDTDTRNAESPQFWGIRIDEPVVVHDDLASQVKVQFQGDFVLELKGATLEGHGRHRDVVLASGTWEEGLFPGVPSDTVYHQRNILLRLFVTNATVDLDVHGGSPDILWAAKSAVSLHDGKSTLQEAAGNLRAGRDIHVLENEAYTLPAHTRLALQPGASEMSVRVTAVSSDDGSLFRAQAPATYAGTVGILALLTALGLGAWRRWGQTPTLRHMEAAIERGRFSRAARLAKRLLRRKPDSEDALLGRAIALSRHGRPALAIQEVQAHLEKSGASDGSLHYVLGASYLELGRLREAQIALDEAVRRTPSLRDGVADLLGQSPAASRRPEVNGYV